MQESTGEMNLRESQLVEPSMYSPELSQLLGVGARTARKARCLRGFVAAGDVAVLRDSSIVLCKAPIHKEGEPEVHIIAQSAELCRTATDNAVYRAYIYICAANTKP